MICPGCNHPNPEDNLYCGHCGLRLEAAAKSMLRAAPKPATTASVPEKKEPQRTATRGLIPHEIVEFDKQVPLIAEPGADRRRVAPAQRSLQKLQSSMVTGHEREVLREVDRQTTDARASVASRLERERSAPVSEARRETSQPSDVSEPREVREGPVRTETESPPARGYLDWDDTAESGPISGPSFLGLNGSAPAFAYDDAEQAETHWRRNVALVIFLALAGLAAAQWRSIRDMGLEYAKTGSMKIAIPHRSQTPTSTNSDAAATNEPSPSAQAPVIWVDPTRNAAQENARLRAEAEATKNSRSGMSAVPSSAPALQSTQPQPTGQSGAPQTTSRGNQPDVPAMAGPSTATAAPNNAPVTGGNREVTAATDTHDSGKRKRPSSMRTVEVVGTTPGEAEMRRANQSADSSMAAHWLWEALKKGNPEASVQLANMYISGRGVERNCDQALLLLRSAAAKNNAHARAKLGALYATGECVQQDRVQAYHWMTLAQQASPDSEWVEQNRRMLWNQMTTRERSRAR